MTTRQNIIKAIEATCYIKITDEGKPISLEDDLGLDSLDRCEVAMELESRYDIEISDEDQQKTVSDYVNFIERKLHGSAQG
jgi:acyl carrier protein